MRENHACDSIIQVVGDGELCQGMAFSADTKLWRPEVRDAALWKACDPQEERKLRPL